MLLRFLDHAVEEQFVTPVTRRLVQVAKDAEDALQWIERHRGVAWDGDNARVRNPEGLEP